MKRTLWNITVSSIITLAAYLALYAVWGAILSTLENQILKFFLIALMTTAAFGFFLLYKSKIRNSVGEDEIVSDYKDKEYISFTDDFRLILKRESQMLICMISIVVVCFALNTFDEVVFGKGKKMISAPALVFAPMCMFESVINVPFVGYVLSAVLDCAAYIAFLLLYRKKKYDYWMKNKL
ncbi:MAG: hypothetical protein IJ449_12155 [Clostridia bacterium]|nr:hypothetical protein [Clostridia bacterium]